MLNRFWQFWCYSIPKKSGNISQFDVLSDEIYLYNEKQVRRPLPLADPESDFFSQFLSSKMPTFTIFICYHRLRMCPFGDLLRILRIRQEQRGTMIICFTKSFSVKALAHTSLYVFGESWLMATSSCWSSPAKNLSA